MGVSKTLRACSNSYGSRRCYEFVQSSPTALASLSIALYRRCYYPSLPLLPLLLPLLVFAAVAVAIAKITILEQEYFIYLYT